MSFTCADTETICDGTPLQECAALLADCERLVAIGVNCLAPGLVLPIVKKLRRWLPDKDIVVYPNSGETYDPDHWRWTGPAQAVDFGESAIAWKDAGATMIGGCCRTGPAHIKNLKEVLLS